MLDRSGFAARQPLRQGPRSRSSRPTRATSCSRPRRSSSTRSHGGDRSCRSAAGPSCSCARTTSAASSPAWSTCRATATPPRSGCGWRTSCNETFGGEQRRVHDARCQRVGPGPAALRRPGAAGRARSAGSTSRAGCLEQRLVEATPDLGRGPRRRACAPSSARRTATGCSAATAGRSPRPTRRTFTAARASADLRAPRAASAPTPARASRLYRARPTPRRAIRRFKLFRATRSSLTDVLPFFTDMGVEVVDERPYEVDARRRRRRCTSTTSACASTTPRIWAGVRRTSELRELLRGRRSPPSGTAAPSPTGSTARPRGRADLAPGRHPADRARSTCARPGRRSRQEYVEDALVSNPAIARDARRAVRDPLRPRPVSRGDGERPSGARRRRGDDRRARSLGALDDVAASTRTGSSAPSSASSSADPAHELLPGRRRTARRAQALRLAQARPARRARPARPRGRSSRSGSTARGSRACTCASARSPAAACAGRTGGRTSAPRSSAWSRRRWSRTPSSCRPGPRAASSPSSCPTRPSTARPGWRRAVAPTGRSSPACSTSPTTGVRRPRSVAARRDVVRHDGDDPYLVVAADKGTATFSDIANGIAQSLRVLARRRLRLGRLGRLRPQGDGHHRPRRVGVGQAALPRDGRRHPDAGLHRRRRRRHERRRVRQRDAALRAHPARRRVRPPPRLRRPRPGCGDVVRRARAAVRAAALVVGRLRHAR